MTEHYLNVLSIRLRGYSGHPLPENLMEETALQVSVAGPLDLEKLAGEITTDDLASGVRRIQQRLSVTTWGASGSGAELIIDVPAAILSGLASGLVVWDAISKRILRHGRPRILDAEAQARSARAWLAESLNIAPESVQILGLEPVGQGSRVELKTPKGSFTAEADSTGVTRMHRQHN